MSNNPYIDRSIEPDEVFEAEVAAETRARPVREKPLTRNEIVGRISDIVQGSGGSFPEHGTLAREAVISLGRARFE